MSSFLTIVFSGIVSYFILCLFVYENISEDALDILLLIGISLLALFAAYVTFKIIKLIYCIGYNIFLFIDKKFSIVQKYHKVIPPKTKKVQTQDYINSLQKEIEELKHKLDESKNNSVITDKDFNEISSESKQNDNELTYNEVKLSPEYKIIKDYTSKLKIIDLKKFIDELSPFDYNKTINILAVLIADGTLTKYAEGYCLYAEYDAILSSIDSMSENGIEFEHFTVELLSKNGFTNIKRTQSSGDYGIDVLAEKDSVTYAIQCKCYSKSVGNKAVQEAYSGKDFYRCMVAVVFTNNYFTKSAIETAKQNNVILWDRNKLIEFIKPLQNNNYASNEFYKENFSNLLKKMGNDIITNYNAHNILLKVNKIYPDNNGVLWELEVKNIDDIANVHLYIDELKEKLNTKVILKEPLEYPKVFIYINYPNDLLDAYNNYKSSL